MKTTHYRFLLVMLLMLPSAMAVGQQPQPKFAIVAADHSSPKLLRSTNYNPSLYLGDSILAVVFDSLRTDEAATIITVYETDADSTIGLWQIGSSSNRALWLNSQRVAYENFSFRYQSSNEHGVVVHSMSYKYPAIKSGYDGKDTLIIGKEGNDFGQKNFCALYYYKGTLPSRQLRIMESALAIRYGALLHGPYLSGWQDTLWHTLDSDSLFSFGVCGIGHDENTGLQQPKSVIRGDLLALEAAVPMPDGTYVMMGHDGNSANLGNDTMIIGETKYMSVGRTWKLRATTKGAAALVNLAAKLPYPPESMNLLVSSDKGDILYASRLDSIVFDSVSLASALDCYATILVNTDRLSLHPDDGDTGGEVSQNNEHMQLMLSPNPTSGKFSLRVDQSQDDIIEVRTVDLHGRLIERHATSEPLSQYTYNGNIDTDGIYYVTVSSNGHQQTIKLVVIR